MPDIGSLLGLVFNNGGMTIAFFVAWYLTFKHMNQSADRRAEEMNKRFEEMLAAQSHSWTEKLNQEREERERQYGVFRDLMEQNSLNTGNIAGLKTSMSEMGGKLERVAGEVRDGFRDVHHRLDSMKPCRED